MGLETLVRQCICAQIQNKVQVHSARDEAVGSDSDQAGNPETRS